MTIENSSAFEAPGSEAPQSVEPQTMSHPSNGSDAPASQDVAEAAKEHTAAIAQTVSESG